MSATSSSQFSLRWNNYAHHITYAIDSLRSHEHLVDVTLCCEGRKIRAHKMLLSACSKYFKDVFIENPCQHPIIVFKNVKFDDLWAIVQFMYQGEVNVQQDSLPSFLNTAEMLSVQGLTDSEIPTNYEATTSAKSNVMDASPLLIKDTITTTATGTDLNPPPIKSTTSLKSECLKPIPFTVMTNNANMTQSEMLSLTLSTNTTNKIRTINVRGESQENIPTTIEPAFKRQRQSLKDDLQQQTINLPITDLSSAMPFIENDEIERADITAPADECMFVAAPVDNSQNKNKKRFSYPTIASPRPTQYLKLEAPEFTEIDTATEQQLQEQLTENLDPSDTEQHPHNKDIEDSTRYTVIEDPDDPDMEIIYQSQNEEVNSGGFSSLEINRMFSTQSSDSGSPIKQGNISTDVPTSKWSQCKFCKLVITTVNLWRHIRTQHTTQPPRQCEHCQKKFKNKYSLREHVRIAHEQKICASKQLQTTI